MTATPTPLTALSPCIAEIGNPGACESCAVRPRLCASLNCHVRTLAPGRHAFHQRDPATHVHWVKRGLLRLYRTLANGKRQIIGFAFPGEFVDLSADRDYRYGAQAVTATELRIMPRATFTAAAREHPQFSFQLFVAVSGMLERSSDLALTIGQRSAEASLAAFLLEMHRRVSAGDPSQRDILLPMPRTDIADHLGLTPETISRLFTRFARRDIIAVHRRRGIKLTAIAALERLAEGLPYDRSAS